MNKKLIYVCSPYSRGDIDKNVKMAKAYCREIMIRFPDLIPIAPHIYFTNFLDDNNPKEREKGLESGLYFLENNVCNEIWVFGIEDPSEGMKAEIECAKKHDIPVRNGFSVLPKGIWEKGDQKKLKHKKVY